MSDTDSDDAGALSLFQEPDDFYQPDKPATKTSYLTRAGTEIPLQLVGQSPLWGHLLWNAGRVIAQHLEDNADSLLKGKTVLELGAGAGLPSIISVLGGAEKVIVTDYPDRDLIENLDYNIKHALESSKHARITARGYLWGNEVDSLIELLPDGRKGFDLLILADILFNHSEHEKLISTISKALNQDTETRALVFFTPYRPHLLEKDLHFFEIAKRSHFVVSKLFEHQMSEVMFPNDPGDEVLRKTVFAFELRRDQKNKGRTN